MVEYQAASSFAYLQNSQMCCIPRSHGLASFPRRSRIDGVRVVGKRSMRLVGDRLAAMPVWLLGIGIGFSLLSGCHQEVGEAGAAAKPPPMPIPEVGFVQPVERKIVDYREYTGRTAAVDIVEIRSRVSGYILETPRSTAEDQVATGTSTDSRKKLGEGSKVEEGDLLFLIDPEPYELAARQATASIAAAQATLTRSEKELARLNQLRASNSISQAEVDETIAALEESKAQVENLVAAKERAELDLRFTKVLAPFDGLVGQALVTRGNLVVADSTVLTTIVSTDPIYVYFDVDEESLLDYRRRIREGAVQSARNTQINITMALANETEFVHQGYIDFVDNTTDPDTGNTRIRGTFPNGDNSLSPGLFARVKIPFTAAYPALMVPSRALGMDQQGRFLLVVDSEGVARRRAVEVGSERDAMTVVSKGLKLDDKVIVEGLQKARPGSPVTAVPPKQDTSEAAMPEGVAP